MKVKLIINKIAFFITLLFFISCVYHKVIELTGDTSTDSLPDAPPSPANYPVCPLGWDCETFSYPTFSSPPPVDILVVVDNSGSMAQEQENLKRSFPALIRNLLDPPLDPISGRRVRPPVRDIHIGVISTDMGVAGYPVPSCERNPVAGDNGLLQSTPHGGNCSPSYPEGYLDYTLAPESEPNLSDIEKLASDFGCIAVLGTDGCGMEQQLEAAFKALSVNMQEGGANYGFLRDDAILGLLFVTDEEDCSAADYTIFDVSTIPYNINLACFYQKNKLHSVSRYSNYLLSLKDNPQKIAVGMIVGVPPDEPKCNGTGNLITECLSTPQMIEKIDSTQTNLELSCTYPPGCIPSVNCTSEAFPARRFVELAQNLGDSAVVHSICTGDFTPALQSLTEKITRMVVNVCSINTSPTVEKKDSCHCKSNCKLIEMLSDSRNCPTNKSPYTSADGKTTWKNPTNGIEHSLCEIPASLTTISDCLLSCIDPSQRFTPVTSGWYYIPVSGENPCPRIEITDDMKPETNSTMILMCP